MASKLRFRLVAFGPPDRPAEVSYLWEGRDGRTCFREVEFTYRLEPRLEAVTVQDLPAPWRDLPATLLPVQETVGRMPGDAFEGMLIAARELRAKGVAGIRKSA
ncbi:MAG: hypothetical protein HY690_08440 [Chloroflexi bacterium]|nr:hypothetical protein [Chloroflexota bacterium]